MAKVWLLILHATLSWGAPSKLETKIGKSGIPREELSLYVAREGVKPETVLEINADTLKIPASITKIATASAVLSEFPPGHKFKTSLWIDGLVKSGTLKGHVYLKGGGDPSFVSENMWYLVNAFLRSGIRRIDGDIVVDDSLFDKIRFDDSREDARVDRAYDAPVGAMSFNWNSINIFVRPSAPGESAHVVLDPENDYTVLVNKAKTSRGNGVAIDVKKVAGKENETLTVGGQIGSSRAETVIFKNITQPDLWAGHNLRSFLGQRMISVTGKVRTGVTPTSATLAAESESKPVELTVLDMNKFSNNFVAEMLTKNLAAKASTPATLAAGVEKIRMHLTSLGLKKDEFALVNPSGLTRENRFSARSMWKVLHHLRADFRVQPDFFASLPIAGVDGTLKRRMKGTAAERWVRAKTGLLTGVTALAGYAGTEDGDVYSFVFIHNGRRDESKVRAQFDDWLETLVTSRL